MCQDSRSAYRRYLLQYNIQLGALVAIVGLLGVSLYSVARAAEHLLGAIQ